MIGIDELQHVIERFLRLVPDYNIPLIRFPPIPPQQRFKIRRSSRYNGFMGGKAGSIHEEGDIAKQMLAEEEAAYAGP